MHNQGRISAFGQGRIDAFTKMRDKLAEQAFKRSERYDIYIDDCAGMAVHSISKDQRLKLHHLMDALCLSLDESFVLVLDALEAGISVYDLTGVEHIKSYKMAVDGDMNAGIRSAATDFKIMLLTFDHKAFVGPAQEQVKAMVEFKDDQDLPREFIEQESTSDMVERLLNNAAAMSSHYLLSFIEEDLLLKTHKPSHIEFESRAETKNSILSTLFRKLAKQEHYISRNARRASKIPNLWPPIKDPLDQFSVKIVEEEQARKECDLEEEEGAAQEALEQEEPKMEDISCKIADYHEKGLADNYSQDFASGYKELLGAYYNRLQHFHFESVAQDIYASVIGLPERYESYIQEVAGDSCITLRDSIRDKLQNDQIKGNGISANDGKRAAFCWIAHQIKYMSSIKTEDIKNAELVIDGLKNISFVLLEDEFEKSLKGPCNKAPEPI